MPSADRARSLEDIASEVLCHDIIQTLSKLADETHPLFSLHNSSFRYPKTDELRCAQVEMKENFVQVLLLLSISPLLHAIKS